MNTYKTHIEPNNI